ncbi:EamA family transporter RarD [Lentibacter sp. XHP0401]|uniref:EamA family transporter RarD n=1 Tax=Lentibacter sp. XHP0401 TaxID=2984334 RepID=UPI0021E8F9EE|nr:EamA family transporter RarD [Lentibacter sp. XHP0401]MCV2891787.1 EamA family transporter RarD [Lentibacter sp. XHP0401]
MKPESAKGVVAMCIACLIWGFSPLYYKLLAHIPPLEILAHRTIWSFLIFSVLLLAQRRISVLLRLFATSTNLMIVGLAALMISANWFAFIYSIQVGHAVEAALGYYIFPLVAVLLGRVVFSERLRPAQWAAVALAALAVSLLTYGLGVAPWISLFVAVTFGLYGVVKKRLTAGPVVSVTGEVALLFPVALAVLVILHAKGEGHFGTAAWENGMLVFSGILTATPLMLFSYATQRNRLSTIGLLQYINPTAQFFCAVVIFGEPFGFWHAMAFGLIWAGLTLYSVSSFTQDRASRR